MHNWRFAVMQWPNHMRGHAHYTLNNMRIAERRQQSSGVTAHANDVHVNPNIIHGGTRGQCTGAPAESHAEAQPGVSHPPQSPITTSYDRRMIFILRVIRDMFVPEQ